MINAPVSDFDLTWSFLASSSAVLFLEFMSECPHCGQSTNRWLHVSQSKWPSEIMRFLKPNNSENEA